MILHHARERARRRTAATACKGSDPAHPAVRCVSVCGARVVVVSCICGVCARARYRTVLAIMELIRFLNFVILLLSLDVTR